MSRGSREQVAGRRSEIMEACSKLYETKSFCEITLSEIGSMISCNRSSIYTYFPSKEELFLAILQEEYQLWNEDLRAVLAERPQISDSVLPDILADSLAKRGKMLKILSMDLFNIEKNSSLEALTEFKKVYGETLSLVGEMLDRLLPLDPQKPAKEWFIYSFFPFLFGIYPYVSATEKQKAAMDIAGVPYKELTIREMVYNTTKRMIHFPFYV